MVMNNKRIREEDATGKAMVFRLSKLIQKTGWSQEETAQKIGVSYVTVNRYLKGHHLPKHLFADMLESFLKKHGG